MNQKSYKYCLKSGKYIYYTLEKGSSKRKHIGLQIDYYGDLIIKLPSRATRQHALNAIQQKSSWILQQLNKIQSRPKPLTLSYTSGEKHLYLGSWYPIKVLDIKKNKPILGKRVSLINGEIQITPASNSSKSVKLLLLQWYQQELQNIITNKLLSYVKKIPWLNQQPPIIIKKMKQRWGSCNDQGTITINMHLVKTPIACLDYVLLHEIAHLKELNHTPSYYAILTKLMPNWKEVKSQLDQLTPLITSE